MAYTLGSPKRRTEEWQSEGVREFEWEERVICQDRDSCCDKETRHISGSSKKSLFPFHVTTWAHTVWGWCAAIEVTETQASSTCWPAILSLSLVYMASDGSLLPPHSGGWGRGGCFLMKARARRCDHRACSYSRTYPCDFVQLQRRRRKAVG